MTQYEVGDTIRYSPFGGGIRSVKVTGKDADIKNCKPGFIGILTDSVSGAPVPSETEPGTDQTVWGYDNQIVSVHTTYKGK